MRYCFGVAIAVVLLACGACSDDDTDGGGGEPAGSADYRVRNDSSHDLTIACVAAPGSPVDCEAGPFPASPGATVELGSDVAIGSNPVPSWSLDEVSASAVPAGGSDLVVVYSQQPVDTALWLKESLDNNQYGDSRYTLVLDDTMIAFPP
jgi:hypothetical protein